MLGNSAMRLLSVLVTAALAVSGVGGRHLLQTATLAPVPAASTGGILNTTDPDVANWANTFERYYGLSSSLAQRPGGNKTVSYEIIFLLANAALNAAAAKNVVSTLNTADPRRATLLQNAITYSQEAGNQGLSVVKAPEARVAAILNITAYTQLAAEADIATGTAAAAGNVSAAVDFANKAVVAAGNGLFAAQIVPGPAPSPLEVPY